MPSTSTSYWPVVWLMKPESLYAQMSGVIGHLTSALSVCLHRSSDWRMLLIQQETKPIRHLIPWGFTVLKSNSCEETENTEALHEDDGERKSLGNKRLQIGKACLDSSVSRSCARMKSRCNSPRSRMLALSLTLSLSISYTHTHTLVFFSVSLPTSPSLSLSLFSTLSPFQFNLVCFYCHG